MQGGTGKVSSGICCMEFEASGMVLWVGDEKVLNITLKKWQLECLQLLTNEYVHEIESK